MSKGNKIYFDTRISKSGIYFVSKKNSHFMCTLRFAGYPKFIIKELIKQNGKKEGIEIYKKLMNAFAAFTKEENAFSPFVIYPHKNDNGRNICKDGGSGIQKDKRAKE